MKQAQDMTAPQIFGKPCVFQPVDKHIASGLCGRAKKAVRRLVPARRLLISAAAVFFLAALFIGCSYLFLAQLAAFGW